MQKLAETLDQIIERFDSKDHENRWPEASNMVAVQNEQLRAELDTILDTVLGSPCPESTITLAAPGERSSDKPYPRHFVIGRFSATAPTTPYLTLADWQCLPMYWHPSISERSDLCFIFRHLVSSKSEFHLHY
jgi:uncharacterized protein (TIGR04141 family)